MTTPSQMMIGFFRDPALARQALHAAQQSGWIDEEHSRLLTHSHEGLLERLTHPQQTSGPSFQETLGPELFGSLPQAQQSSYQREWEKGATALLLSAQDHILELRDVLHSLGAYQVWLPLTLGGEQRIPLLQEVPQLSKEVVVVGEIRIHKRIVTENRTFTIPITREEVVIERVPAQTPSSSSAEEPIHATTTAPSIGMPSSTTATSPSTGMPSSQEELAEAGTLRILVHEEQVRFEKRTVVTEEILVHKQMLEETRQLVEPLKHETVRIEQIGQAPVHQQERVDSLAQKAAPYDGNSIR